MPAKTLSDIRQREPFRCIGLITLWNTLEVTDNAASEESAFDDLLILVAKGLKATAPNGGLVDQDVLYNAIEKAKAAYLALIDEIFDDPNPARGPSRKEVAKIWSEEINGEKLGLLRICEADYSDICACLELPTYWWPIAKRADKKEHFEERQASPIPKEARKIQRCAEGESGLMRLEAAVNLVVGASETEKLSAAGSSGWTLWQAALTAKTRGTLPECERDGKRFVRMEGFIQWAKSRPTALGEGNRLWTPDSLIAERARWESAKNREGCPLAEQDEATRRIQWADDLLRRFSEVGMRPQSQCQQDESTRPAVHVPNSPLGSVHEINRSIGAQKFLRLLGSQLRYGDGDENPHGEMYRVTDEGVGLWPLNSRDWELMTNEEQQTWREQEANAKLTFPCSAPEFVTWVSLQGEGFSFDEAVLKRYLEESTEPDNERAAGSPKKIARTRRTRLTRAIEMALEKLRNRLKREPTSDEVFDYLAEHDETGAVEDYTDDQLTWRDTKGDFHDTRRKTFENTLSRIRQRVNPSL